MKTALKRYKTLQTRHIKALKDEKTDVDRLIFEKDRAFEDIKSCFSAMPRVSISAKVSISDSYQHQIFEILENNKILVDNIKLRQQELSKSISSSQKAKTILKGYQGMSNSSTNSRFMKTTG